jgi:hypothetical protein
MRLLIVLKFARYATKNPTVKHILKLNEIAVENFSFDVHST